MNYIITNGQGKRQYERLDEIQTRSSSYHVLRFIFVGLCMILLILSAWNFNNTINQTLSIHVVYLNSKRPLLHTVSDKFLSFGLDTSLLRNMTELPINNKKFLNLARHLAPAFVRIGGTSADCLYFNQTSGLNSEEKLDPINGQDISNFTISDKDFENIYNFAVKTKLQMIFDLNALIRQQDGSWETIEAKNIILFAKNRNMMLDWQLGNEPNSFQHVFNITVDPVQLANDYYTLRQLLNEMGYKKSLLVGPEVNHVGDVNHKGECYVQTFLENAKDSVNYVTWHQYYLNGRVAKMADFINVSTFNYLPMQINSMYKAITLSGKEVPTWLSETSTAFGGGAPELSDRFVAGFLWLDKLGYSAFSGVNVVTRQSLLGGNYAMVGDDLLPNPDWWVSVVFKQFVSEKVLKLSTTNNFDFIRLYAHCTPEKVLISRVSAITIYGVNIGKHIVHLNVDGIPVFRKTAKVFVYILTSDNLQSRAIKMNGKILRLQADGSLPPFRPIILEPTIPIAIPPYSMVFIVIHGADVPPCKI